MICSISSLKPEQLTRIQNLEKEVGQTLLAISFNEVKMSNPEQEALKKIQAVEAELGVVLLAVKG
ncbi:MAG: hypothetical protein HOI23_10645 [Deltaproteobacteria bacterium]|jgi:hypothetical protein|nr:hypothetical protein [Deltaproteobacteria bacterium]MBT6433013.1 hypothetical protein [Deltaproteobacteria bacterium]